MASEKQPLKVVMLPWLAHGHISPFLDLAKNLSDRNFQSYIVSTPVNLVSIKNKIEQKYSHSIHLLDLHLPTLPELPPHYHTTNGLPLRLHPTLRKALKMSKPGVENILETLKPDLVIYDIVVQWAGGLASRVNVRSVTFFTSGAAMISYFVHMMRYPGVEFPFSAIRLTEFELTMVRGNIESAMSDEMDADEEAGRSSNGIILVNSSREMEGEYVDYLSELMGREIVPIGALCPRPNIGDDGSNDDSEMIMEWLGGKNEFSSVFVSFGSEYFLKKEDIEEIAYGLELSGVNFVWIIRFPKGDEMRVENALPDGFLERVGERGKIVEKWAPQAKILSHSSVGGFVSHCGWNSLKEGIDFGVPIIAMPMHLDQPMNAKLVVELGVGVEVKRDDKGMLQREEISKVIKDVVFGEIGGSLRRKVGDQREKIRSRSRDEMDGVVEKLNEVIGKSIDTKDYIGGMQGGEKST